MALELVFDTSSQRFLLQEFTLPRVGPRDVRVRLELAAPKHGTESHAWTGTVRRGRRWDRALRLFLDPVPAHPVAASPTVIQVGNMATGVIETVGADVEGLRQGDHVYGYMPVRDMHQMPGAQVHLLPADLTPEAAVCIDPARVAVVAVRDGQVRLGDWVAVFGLGAIGLLTVQAARASGAERVIAIDPLTERRMRALHMGADAAFDPRDGDVALAIKEATARKGVDIAIETSGADTALHEAIRCLRQCGTVVAVGWSGDNGRQLYLGEEFHVNRPHIVDSQASPYWGNPDRDHPRWDTQRVTDACVALFRRSALRPTGILDPIVSLDEAPEILQIGRKDPAQVLKVGIRLDN